jgi:hypothetical protein
MNKEWMTYLRAIHLFVDWIELHYCTTGSTTLYAVAHCTDSLDGCVTMRGIFCDDISWWSKAEEAQRSGHSSLWRNCGETLQFWTATPEMRRGPATGDMSPYPKGKV